MWVQIIQGKAKDPAGLRKQLDRWEEEIQPNAKGFVGSTSGITDDGDFILVARFESEELAMQNSDDPKQSEWWNETSQYIEGEATFRNCNEVETIRNGGSNDAGFVQVIQNTFTDPDRAREIGRQMMDAMPDSQRPDFLGGIVAFDGEVSTQTAYFNSEAEAREGERQSNEEQSGDQDSEAAKLWEEMGSLMKDVKYFDLREPKMI